MVRLVVAVPPAVSWRVFWSKVQVVQTGRPVQARVTWSAKTPMLERLMGMARWCSVGMVGLGVEVVRVKSLGLMMTVMGAEVMGRKLGLPG